jgi:transcriptional regulator of acetoin/glycerol metabolism
MGQQKSKPQQPQSHQQRVMNTNINVVATNGNNSVDNECILRDSSNNLWTAKFAPDGSIVIAPVKPPQTANSGKQAAAAAAAAAAKPQAQSKQQAAQAQAQAQAQAKRTQTSQQAKNNAAAAKMMRQAQRNNSAPQAQAQAARNNSSGPQAQQAQQARNNSRPVNALTPPRLPPQQARPADQ